MFAPAAKRTAEEVEGADSQPNKVSRGTKGKGGAAAKAKGKSAGSGSGAKHQSKKTDAAKDEEEFTFTRAMVIDLLKVLVHHDGHHRAASMAENLVLVTLESDALNTNMDYAMSHYADEGKQSRQDSNCVHRPPAREETRCHV